MSDKATEDLASIATAGVLGHAVGDALGVPVEFQHRQDLQQDPLSGMRSGGAHGQPAGTWSDDTSLTLCLVESLCEMGIDYQDQARRFIRWLNHAEWTPHGEVFDVGIATREAISRLDAGAEPTEAGLSGERDNGNGALMRILPIALYLAFVAPKQRIKIVMKCSRLTHGHPRSQITCALFAEIAAALARKTSMSEATALAQAEFRTLIRERHSVEETAFTRLLSPNIGRLDESELSGSGYVIHCLESSLWCALRAGTYAEGVLAAVNLGEDSDTTGAVTGGLLGLRFGLEAIPDEWVTSLARVQDILALCRRFEQVCRRRWKSDR